MRLEIKVSRDGSVTSSEVLQPSGFGLLDKAALSAAKKATPFDAIPEVIKEEPLLLVVPIAFKLTD